MESKKEEKMIARAKRRFPMRVPPGWASWYQEHGNQSGKDINEWILDLAYRELERRWLDPEYDNPEKWAE